MVTHGGQFLRDTQRYLAVSSVGPSALRNQGAKGVLKAAQEHLAILDLARFDVESEESFLKVLDGETKRLRRALPDGARNWGAARKAMNLFLRDVCYNRFLSERYGLAKLERWMEIPLDNLVGNGLKRRAGRGVLPPWPGLRNLTPDISREFQAHAKWFANKTGISRIHLDMQMWIEERK